MAKVAVASNKKEKKKAPTGKGLMEPKCRRFAFFSFPSNQSCWKTVPLGAFMNH